MTSPLKGSMTPLFTPYTPPNSPSNSPSSAQSFQFTDERQAQEEGTSPLDTQSFRISSVVKNEVWTSSDTFFAFPDLPPDTSAEVLQWPQASTNPKRGSIDSEDEWTLGGSPTESSITSPYALRESLHRSFPLLNEPRGSIESETSISSVSPRSVASSRSSPWKTETDIAQQSLMDHMFEWLNKNPLGDTAFEIVLRPNMRGSFLDIETDSNLRKIGYHPKGTVTLTQVPPIPQSVYQFLEDERKDSSPQRTPQRFSGQGSGSTSHISHKKRKELNPSPK